MSGEEWVDFSIEVKLSKGPEGKKSVSARKQVASIFVDLPVEEAESLARGILEAMADGFEEFLHAVAKEKQVPIVKEKE